MSLIVCKQSNPNAPLQEEETRDSPKHIPNHLVREAVNPRTGRRERVFVDLEAVYPDHKNPSYEVSFEELRAIRRGWMSKRWCSQKKPLQQISGNAGGVEHQSPKLKGPIGNKDLPEQFDEKLTINGHPFEAHEQTESHESKPAKSRRFKIQGETQTSKSIPLFLFFASLCPAWHPKSKFKGNIDARRDKCTLYGCQANVPIVKMKFDSPTNSKVRRKSSREPTMTMHTRAATDEIYGLFNQPLKVETEDAADSLFGSDYEDDDCASNADTTVTGHLSGASSDFGDEETQMFPKPYDDTEYGDTTQPGSVADGIWTDCSVSKKFLDSENGEATSHSAVSEDSIDNDSRKRVPERERFVPQMPEDYVPPCGTYRDPAIMAQNRLPFMTPIVERTESSISMTAARNCLPNAKTPSRPRTPAGMPQMGDLLGSSPLGAATPYEGDHTITSTADIPFSPIALRALAPTLRRREVVIKDAQCNPTDKGIRNTILNSLEPSLASYSGYHDHVKDSNYASIIQKYVKAHTKKRKSSDGVDCEVPILDFPGAKRRYIIRRQLGAGAYAPVYLAESIDDTESSNSDVDGTSSLSPSVSTNHYQGVRFPFEAVKVENSPSSSWEFYMIRTAHERLRRSADYIRSIDSIVRAHELHVHQKESFLVEDYRGQGTLLDLVNIVRTESITTNHNIEGGIDESLAMFFSIELLRTVEALHANGILHGDIKADNCLVRLEDPSPDESATKPVPFLGLDTDQGSTEGRDSVHYSPTGHHGWRNKGLTLIDFGRGIDMYAFSPNVQFIADWETGSHECNEIREMRPWTHQIDLYGIAGTIHVLLFGKYIESTPVRTSGGGSTSSMAHVYRIRESLKRYWDRELWAEIFDLLLNPGTERWMQIEHGSESPLASDSSTPGLPVTKSMRYLRRKMEDWLAVHAEKKCLASQLRKIQVLLAERKKKIERF